MAEWAKALDGVPWNNLLVLGQMHSDISAHKNLELDSMAEWAKALDGVP